MGYYIEKLKKPYDKNEKSEIIGLWKKNGISNPEERFDWLYNDPYSKENIETFLVKKEEEIIGFASIIKKVVSDRKYLTPANYLIDKAHRTIGPALMVQKAILNYIKDKADCDAVIGYPNKNSGLILNRLDYQKAEATRRLVFVVNPFRYLVRSELILNASYPVFSYIIRIYLLFLLLKRRNKLRESSKICVSSLLSGSSACDFFDDFSQWRYINNPTDYFHFYSFTFDSESKPIIFVYQVKKSVVNIINIKKKKKKILCSVLIDFMASILKRHKNISSFSISAVFDKHSENIFKDIGYVARDDEEKRFPMYYSIGSDGARYFENNIIFDGQLDL